MPTFVCPVDSMMRDGIADHIGEKRGEKHAEKLHRCVSWLCRADSDSSQRFTLKIETASERGAGGGVNYCRKRPERFPAVPQCQESSFWLSAELPF